MNWPGLLAWSTKYHDGTKPTEFKQLSDEDRAFLEKAMEDAFGKMEDPNAIMAEAIGMIKATDRNDITITTALEIIDKSCDDPDCARNCEKLDGLQPLLDLLSSHPTGAICNRTLEILALLFSNNPNIQEAGHRRGAIDVFVRLVNDSSPGDETRSKAFRALVSLVRSMPKMEEQFLREKSGVSIMVSCCDPSDLRLCEKVASFARSLAADDQFKTEDVAALATVMVPLLANIGSGQVQYQETLSSSVCELARVAPASCPPELKAAAQSRIAAIEDPESAEKVSLVEFISVCDLGVARVPAVKAAAPASTEGPKMLSQ